MDLQPLARLKMGAAFFTPLSNSVSMPGFTSICAISRIMIGFPLAVGRVKGAALWSALSAVKRDKSSGRWPTPRPAPQRRAAPLRPRVFSAAEEAILLVVARLVADRFKRGQMRERAFDRIAPGDLVGPGLDRRIFGGVDGKQLEIAQPRPRRDVRDGVLAAGNIRPRGQSLFIEVEQFDHLRAVTLGAVVVAGTGELAEMNVLATHRADIGYLEHKPLQGVVAGDRLVRDELPGLLGEVDQNRARLDHRIWLASWPVAIDDRRHFKQRVD